MSTGVKTTLDYQLVTQEAGMRWARGRGLPSTGEGAGGGEVGRCHGKLMPG